MKIHSDYSIKKINAFKLDVKAKYFALPGKTEELRDILKTPKITAGKILIIGDGTNTLFRKNFDGLVIKLGNKGIKKVGESKDNVHLRVAGGENWDKLVQHTIKNTLSGLENMSYIPGTVGAAPIQNIAAYGQNFEDVFISLEAINLKTKKTEIFDKKDCEFSYRDSIFKNRLKNKYAITSVTIKLSKKFDLNSSYYSRYGSLENELKKIAKKPYRISDVRKAIIRIRKRKFPDPKKYSTAGSFFLNPVISAKELKRIQEKYPNVQYYPIDNLSYPVPNKDRLNKVKFVKVAAGWLLEELGWKGVKLGNVGTSPNQSLVIIGNNRAKFEEISNLADKMQRSFIDSFGIRLEREVNIY